jgi:succinyl-CoA synthetase beta subunit
VQRLAMDLAGDVAELDINPLVVRPRGAVALDALIVRK